MTDCTRRSFLKGGLTTAALAGFAPEVLATRWFGGKVKFVDPGRKVNIAAVGCCGKGWSDIDGVSGENIIALCDVDRGNLLNRAKDFPQARLYEDYRKMFEDLGEEIDAVTISTPDHMHFPIAMLAMQMGKHVYVQKPCAHTVWEAVEMGRAAKRYGVASQMGNQGHASNDTRRAYAWLREGAIGDVTEVHVYSDRPIWPQRTPWGGPAPVPPNLNWNLWCGTGPLRNYPNNINVHFNWRGWWDYGCGAIGDMACHIMDVAFWALDLRSPIWVEAESDAPNSDTTPKWSRVTYYFGPRGSLPPLTLKWFDGKHFDIPRPPLLEEGRSIFEGNGQVFYGTNGCMMAGCYGGSPRIFPETRMKEVGRPKNPLPPVKGGHYGEWLNACRGEAHSSGDLGDYGADLTKLALLGNLAIRSGRRIYWDEENLCCKNDPEATSFIRHPYRRF